MPYHTENAKLIMAVSLMVALLASCALSEHLVVLLLVWGVCGVFGFVALAFGTNEKGIALNEEMSRKRKGRGLSEEEQARDAIAGAMFMGDDFK